jgi:hypothetical protein
VQQQHRRRIHVQQLLDPLQQHPEQIRHLHPDSVKLGERVAVVKPIH